MSGRGRVGDSPPVRNAYVGSPVERIEDLRLLRGRGQFVDDLARDEMLYAAIARSSVAHGRIRSIDSSAARAVPGVHAVITADDIGDPVPQIPLRHASLPQLDAHRQPVIAQHKVRYVGEPLAVVVADSVAVAEDAADAILVDIEPLPPVPDRRASEKGDSLLHESEATNLAITYTGTKGDADAAFADAPYIRRESFSVQRHMAMTMETRGFLAEWDAERGKLTVHGAAKVPHFNRHVLARLIGLDDDAIDLIEVDVGGGFGGRGEFFPEDFLIPFAARQIGRPVKWTEDRREHLLTLSHAREMDCEIEIACRKDGTILGLRGRVYVDMGAYFRPNGTGSPCNVVQFLSGPYRIPNIHLESLALLTNKAPVGTYRAPGRFEADFFRERLLDMVATDLELDRVEFRRRNLVSDAEMPYPIATVSPPENKTEFDSGDHPAVFDRCLREFGWSEKSKLQGKLIDGRYHGLGVGCFVEGGGGWQETAKLLVESDGMVSVFVGSSAVGQGLETVLTQIAADALELPMERIRLLHGSTTYVKEGYGSFASRSTAMGGSAIFQAAATLRNEIRAKAAVRFGCAATDIELADGRAVGPGGQTVDWADLAAAGEVLCVEETFSNTKRTYAYGTAVAHVAVDPKTGCVDLVDFLLVEDVGHMINPLTLHGQAVGAIVQGLGGVFLEHLVYDRNAQLLTVSLADYLIPSATDFPNIRAISLELKPSPLNPLGVKGAGEGGIIPVGGVVANAVASALTELGVHLCALPLSPSHVWHLIAAARGSTKVSAAPDG